jgi:hypothetical protein
MSMKDIPPRRYRIRLCELGWEVYLDNLEEDHPIPVVFHSMEQVVNGSAITTRTIGEELIDNTRAVWDNVRMLGDDR